MRGAHQAFFLDDDEKTRAVELLLRVEEFSGVIVLAYAIMSNHFHIFIDVPEPSEIDDEGILHRINALYREASLAQVLGEWTRLKEEKSKLLECARPTEKYVSRFGEYRRSFLRRMWNSSEFMRTYKQHFTMSFNGRRDHRGTMFEGRYHEARAGEGGARGEGPRRIVRPQGSAAFEGGSGARGAERLLG